MSESPIVGGRGRVVITSSRQVEYAFESGEPRSGGMSAFTAAVVEGLRTGQADGNGDGLIDAQDLYVYVRDALARQGVPQRPQMFLSGEGQIVIAKAKPAELTPPTTTPPVEEHDTEVVSRPPAPTRFSPEGLALADDLEFRPVADALADLIASPELVPPLAVGLFGDWGAGKSFFMDLVRDGIEHRAKAENPAGVDRVVHLRFNAWHYVDANMWASLATRVFQGIAEYLEESTGTAGDAHRKLLVQLQSSQVLLEESERKQGNAEKALAEAEQHIADARATHEKRSLTEVAVSHPESTAAPAGTLASGLGLSGATTSMAKVRDVVDSLREASGTLGQLFTLLRVQAGVRARLRVLAVPLLVLVAGLGTAAVLYAQNAVDVARVLPWVSVVAAAGSALAAGAKKTADILRAGKEVLGVDKLDEELALAQARAEAERARRALREVEQQFDELNALDASGVYRFVSERYTSPEYARYMGVASLIERDLRALSGLLTAAEGERPVERGGQQMRVDRVVLYIDDLDRCPAKTVLEVLQAVHLLLSMPLFVVLVGVDARWLLGAVRGEYRQITDDHEGYREALPFSYLEKIFQIPLWVPTMEDAGYRRLIRSLTNVEAPPPVDRVETPLDGGSWRITEDEAGFLANLGALVRTPRAAKRLTNLYRLLKASSPPTERAALEGPGREHAVALVLAAIATSHPEQTAAVFGALATSAETTWVGFLGELEKSPVDAALCTALRGLADPDADRDLAAFRKWAPRVSRYSFAGSPRP